MLADGAGSQPDYPHALLGDALVLLGASLYAGCNVGQEYLLGAWRCPFHDVGGSYDAVLHAHCR